MGINLKEKQGWKGLDFFFVFKNNEDLIIHKDVGSQIENWLKYTKWENLKEIYNFLKDKNKTVKRNIQ